jgi:hypothetical protein
MYRTCSDVCQTNNVQWQTWYRKENSVLFSVLYRLFTAIFKRWAHNIKQNKPTQKLNECRIYGSHNDCTHTHTHTHQKLKNFLKMRSCFNCPRRNWSKCDAWKYILLVTAYITLTPSSKKVLHLSHSIVFFFWWRAPQQMLRTHRILEGVCDEDG